SIAMGLPISGSLANNSNVNPSGTWASFMDAAGDCGSGNPINESVCRPFRLPLSPLAFNCAEQIRQSKPIFNSAKTPVSVWLLLPRRYLFKIENPFLIGNDNIQEAVTINILNNIV